ncbi:MAG: hypothetical protein J0H16_20200, partial [Alicycliphilus denitrificans]|nr:hypothetical protein [Alicycliphilus denitrificans]
NYDTFLKDLSNFRVFRPPPPSQPTTYQQQTTLQRSLAVYIGFKPPHNSQEGKFLSFSPQPLLSRETVHCSEAWSIARVYP